MDSHVRYIPHRFISLSQIKLSLTDVSVGLFLPEQPDRIRELCELALASENDAELQKIVSELRCALRDHMDDVRVRAAEAMPKTFRAA